MFLCNPVPELLIESQDVHNTIMRRSKTESYFSWRRHTELFKNVNVVQEQEEKGRGIERSSRERVKFRGRQGSHCSYFPKGKVSCISSALGVIGTLFMWEKKPRNLMSY